MRTLDRYIERNFLSGALVVLLILVPLFAFLTLAEELDNVGKGAYTSFDALIVVGYSVPKLILDLLPVTTLLGVLIGLGAMANNRELIIINAFGISARRTAWPVVKAVSLLIVLVLLVQFYVVPQFELNAAKVKSKATPELSIASNDSEFWTRSGNHFIRIGDVIQHGTLRDVEIFELSNQGELQELVQASNVEVLGGGQWLLMNVTITDLKSQQITEEHLKSKMWQSFLSAQQTAALLVPVEAMAPSDLYQRIRLLEKNSLNTHRFRVLFWQQLSLPVSLIAMSLLGLPFLLGSVRNISAGQRAAIGGCVGILFYLAEQTMGHLAILYELSPAPAALGPDILLLAIALLNLFQKK